MTNLRKKLPQDTSSFDLVSFLRREIIPIIRNLGVEKFKEYFLYNEGNYSNEERSIQCGLTIGEVSRVNNFIDDLAIHSDFFHPSRIVPLEQVH